MRHILPGTHVPYLQHNELQNEGNSMKVLCVSDQLAGSKESLIEGIFQGPLRELATVSVVYFSKELSEPAWQGSNLIIPYRYKRLGAATIIGKFIDLHSIDIILVRNFFSVLRSFLNRKRDQSFRLGFWNTFPHTFRRLFQAQQENKSLFRKRIEYFVRSTLENRLVNKCDFLVVMSPEFKSRFFPAISIPWFSLPMGFTPADLPALPLASEDHSPRRFIYTGTVDPLRQSEMIAETMAGMDEDFVLDIYTQSDNSSVNRIRNLGDRRISVRPPLPRRELYSRMTDYDVGIGLIPENELFNVSSPTKVIEYCAVGLPALINHLPEYCALFNVNSAIICDFSPTEIKRAVRDIIAMPKEKLVALGNSGRHAVETKREYSVLTHSLAVFFKEVCRSTHKSNKMRTP